MCKRRVSIRNGNASTNPCATTPGEDTASSRGIGSGPNVRTMSPSHRPRARPSHSPPITFSSQRHDCGLPRHGQKSPLVPIILTGSGREIKKPEVWVSLPAPGQAMQAIPSRHTPSAPPPPRLSAGLVGSVASSAARLLEHTGFPARGMACWARSGGGRLGWRCVGHRRRLKRAPLRHPSRCGMSVRRRASKDRGRELGSNVAREVGSRRGPARPGPGPAPLNITLFCRPCDS